MTAWNPIHAYLSLFLPVCTTQHLFTCSTMEVKPFYHHGTLLKERQVNWFILCVYFEKNMYGQRKPDEEHECAHHEK